MALIIKTDCTFFPLGVECLLAMDIRVEESTQLTGCFTFENCKGKSLDTRKKERMLLITGVVLLFFFLFEREEMMRYAHTY